MDRATLDAAVERGPVNDEGRSGAVLERLTLADGSRVVVKHFDPKIDLVMRMTGDDHGREVRFVRRGTLDRLPPTVRHAALGGWYDEDAGVLVMRDLGDAVLSWTSVVTPAQAATMFRAVADLHAEFLGSPPEGLTPLESVVGLFEPRRVAPYAGDMLIDYALRGWELWPEVAPGEVGDRILALAHDTSPIVAACGRLPATLLHGDLATVNMAFEADHPGCLTLIDWGMATAGPGPLDVGRLLAGCAHLFDVGPDGGPDDLVALYRDAAGAAYDEDAMRLGLLSGIVWLGWNKALDIADHPDPLVRERERVALPWWLRQAELALGTGLVR
jgi:hypothetical protein